MTKLDAIERDMKLKGWMFIDFQRKHDSREVIWGYDFFHMTRHFPGDDNLIKVPSGNIPEFVSTDKFISLLSFYQKFTLRSCQELVSTKISSFINYLLRWLSKTQKMLWVIFSIIFYCKLYVCQMKFFSSKLDAITELVKNINFLFQKNY